MSSIENMDSLKKLKDDVNSFNFFRCIMPKTTKEQFKKLKTDLKDLENVVSKYYNYFSEYGWCAYDSLSLSLMREAIEIFEMSGITYAEEKLIEYYTEEIKDSINRLRFASKGFELRFGLIEKAFEDHFAGRYHASVPVFLMIIDGVINDYLSNKGFWADGIDLDVWDCLVGADDGLAKVRNIICETRKKTNLELIELPYRHGILHGRELGYDNVKVSCKCVALLFAVADWVKLKENEVERKKNFEEESKSPSMKSLIKQSLEIENDSKEIYAWKSRSIKVGEQVPKCGTIDDYRQYEYLQKLVELFNYWEAKNYGYLATCFNDSFFCESGFNARAGECKERFSENMLANWEIKEVEECACARTRVKVIVEYNLKRVEGDIILCYFKRESNTISLPWKNDGEWKITAFNIL